LQSLLYLFQHRREILRAIWCANAYSNTNADSYPHANAYTNSHADSHPHADEYPNSNSYGDIHAYSNAYCYCNAHSYTDTDPMHGKMCTHAEAASDAATAPVGRNVNRRRIWLACCLPGVTHEASMQFNSTISKQLRPSLQTSLRLMLRTSLRA
jgi:hypothetical protein